MYIKSSRNYCNGCFFIAQFAAQRLPNFCPKKFVLSYFILLGRIVKTLILKGFWAVLVGNVCLKLIPHTCTPIRKRAVFYNLKISSNPWGAMLQGFFFAQKSCPTECPTLTPAQLLPNFFSCFNQKWLYNNGCGNTYKIIYFGGF